MLDRAKCLEFATILQDRITITFTVIEEGLAVGAFDIPVGLEEEELRIFGAPFSTAQRDELISSIVEDAREFKTPCYAFFLAHTIYHALDESGETKH